MARWTCLLLLVLPFVAGCNRSATPSAPPERPGLFSIDTDLGLVDVLAFEQKEDQRSIRLHTVYPDGHHSVRTLKIEVEPDPTQPDATRLVESVWGDGTERVRITRSVAEDAGGFDATYASGDETMRLSAFAEGPQIRFQARLSRQGTERTWDQELDPARAFDPGYVAGVRASFVDFYGDGPFRDNEDLALLVAVEESSDWSNHLAETPIVLGTNDEQTARNIRRVCVAAGVVGKVSCFAAKFTPWAYIACIPASGISVACLAYNVSQAFSGSGPDPLPPPRPCTCGCECNHGD